MTDLRPCPTPWCGSTRVQTTTYFKSRKRDDGTREMWVEVDHSCPVCHVRTPQMLPPAAEATWNDRALQEGE